jgi:hypothetical protein
MRRGVFVLFALAISQAGVAPCSGWADHLLPGQQMLVFEKKAADIALA